MEHAMPAGDKPRLPPSPILDRLDPLASRVLTQVVRIAEEEGLEPYLVGGIVRDLFLRLSSQDVDLVMEGDAVAFARRLAGQLGARLVSHHRFGTATLLVHGMTLDLASARTESYPRPGALPVVRAGTLEQDLERRDFTINAMALCLAPSRYGDLVDPLGGMEDLRLGVVSAIHEKSFVDDATRLLRAVRYEQRFGFRLGSETESLLRRETRMLSTISGDRIRHELERIFQEKRPERCLDRASSLDILQAIHPALRWEPWMTEAVRSAEGGGELSAPVLAALMVYRMEAGQMGQVFERLRFPGTWQVAAQEASHLAAELTGLARPGLRPSQLYNALRPYGAEAIHTCRLATGSPIIRGRLGEYLESLRDVRPLLTGEDVIRLGVPRGPAIGATLDTLRQARLDGVAATREDEETLVRRRLAAPASE